MHDHFIIFTGPHAMFCGSHEGHRFRSAITALVFTAIFLTAVYCTTVGFIFMRTDCLRDLTVIHFSVWLVMFGVVTLLLTAWIPFSVFCDPDRADSHAEWILPWWFYSVWGIMGVWALQDDRSCRIDEPVLYGSTIFGICMCFAVPLIFMTLDWITKSKLARS